MTIRVDPTPPSVTADPARQAWPGPGRPAPGRDAPERLTQQVADWLRDDLAPRGVGVVIAAEHQCMSLRGIRATGSRTITSALHGLLREDARSRQEFLALTGTAC